MKKPYFILLTGILLLALTGCKKEDSSIDTALLVGKWIQTSEYDGERDIWRYFEDANHYTQFNADGTGVKGNKESSDPFTYTCDGDAIRIVYSKSNIYIFRIETLTQGEMTLLGEEYKGKNGDVYVDKETFERSK